MLAKKIKQFKNILKINNRIIGVEFTRKKYTNYNHFRDTTCTALARAIIKNTMVIFDNKKFPQLCSGANYFFKLSKINNNKVCDVYVKEEHVFADKKTCNFFLNNLPKLPNELKNKSIVIKPFKPGDKPQVIILLINPAQAGRILGLLNYDQYKTVKIHPNQPTCLSIFAPLITKEPHCNFIDYYDRYYQGRINGKKIWPENKMIVSITFNNFKKILNNLDKSPHGSLKTDLSPQVVDEITIKKFDNINRL